MKTQHNYDFIPDWQVFNYSGNESEKDQETDGLEEEKEFIFYSSKGDDYCFLKEDKGV